MGISLPRPLNPMATRGSPFSGRARVLFATLAILSPLVCSFIGFLRSVVFARGSSLFISDLVVARCSWIYLGLVLEFHGRKFFTTILHLGDILFSYLVRVGVTCCVFLYWVGVENHSVFYRRRGQVFTYTRKLWAQQSREFKFCVGVTVVVVITIIILVTLCVISTCGSLIGLEGSIRRTFTAVSICLGGE